ncbi:MAG: hypothetical protein ACJ754_12310 [Pyrinomonadaceae bacterium]
MAKDDDVPRFAYLLAVLGGVVYTWFAFFLANSVAMALGEWEYHYGYLGAVVFAAAHLVGGGLFGLLWPERTWRWGVWLCLVPVCVVSLAQREVTIFLWVVALTMAPACAGAYAAARVHLKYVEAE